ncbi:DMT family transporter [Paraferrimonas sedimenticola]|uniref:Permease n=1 Tax=Paraferrimonas sedimenticola TaxID=375674 RepID=A0AA37W0F9_9GAMM|nr:DMT family transporter [Paraferrimonas sedimenticola]GLP94932.1 permease [Paraferrimonas sedimenticola]
MAQSASALRWGTLAAITATLIWSGNLLIARFLHADIPPVALATYRWIIATLALLPIAWPMLFKQRREVARHWRFLLPLSLLGVSGFNTFIYIASEHASALKMALMAISFPLFTLIFSRIRYGTLIRPLQIWGLCLVLIAATALIFDGDWSKALSLEWHNSDAWMITAAVSFAIYSMMLPYQPNSLHPLTTLLATFIIGTLCLLPLFLIEGLSVPEYQITPQAWASIAYIGVFASLVAYWLWNQAVAQIGALQAGFCYYLLPVFAGVLGALWLDEPLGWFHGLCALTMVIGLGLIQWRNRRD